MHEVATNVSMVALSKTKPMPMATSVFTTFGEENFIPTSGNLLPLLQNLVQHLSLSVIKTMN